MAEIVATDFEISGTLGLPADKHSATVPDASLFLNANDADTVQLGAGFIDAATMIPYQTGQAEGLIEEWSVEMRHNSVVCKVGGRDRMAELLEHEYDMSYLTAWPTVIQKRDMEDAGRSYKVGFFRASAIAREIAASCEMDLIWNCRDYILREDFTTNGRAIDQILKLMEPWRQVPRFQADIYVVPGVDGKGAILVQARDDASIFDQNTQQFKPSVNCTFTAKDARIKSLSVSRKRSQRFRHVLLYGQIVLVVMRENAESEVEEESESLSYDENGKVIGKTVTRTTYIMPDKRVKKVIVSTYQGSGYWLNLTKRETRTTEWEPSQYCIYGLINNPKKLSETTSIETVSGTFFEEQERERIGYSYDDHDYLVVTFTQKWSRDKTTNRFEERERIVKEHRESSHLETQEVTTLYKPTSAGAVYGNTGQGNTVLWYAAKVDTNRSAGLRPGGPTPPRAISDSGPRLPLKKKGTISYHLRARSVVFTHNSLVEDDLNYLYGCFERASGNWEWTLQMAYVGIPWLRKGMVIYITGLTDHNGTAIPLQPALVTEQKLKYDESSNRPSMVSHLTATFWTSDAGD